MRIQNLIARRIGLLGFGLEGRASARALRRHGHSGPLTIFSDQPVEVPAGDRLVTGPTAGDALADIDLLIRSPGFAPHHPLRRAADERGLAQTTATNLFLAEMRAAGVPVIGITGSKGKSTTCTLTHLLLAAAGVPAVLVGNIGAPALDRLDELSAPGEGPRPVVVMELSSYQCADLAPGMGPSLGCLLDMFPEHLDWHGGRTAYFGAKFRLAAALAADEPLFANASLLALPDAAALEPRASGHRLTLINTPAGLHFADGWFRDGDTRLFADTQMRLPGLHNRRNAVAAFALARRFGVRPEQAAAVLAEFGGLPFRLEDEGLFAGIRFVNDSISTAPEAVAAALAALGPAVATLIAGGHDRGYRFEPLAAAAADSAVDTFILLPDTGAAIAALLRERVPGRTILAVPDLPAAVRAAFAHTPSGRTCLFSPGAPSYNVYESFAERGQHFRALLAEGAQAA